jgi:predicted TIM-barrel fold metal-dependent hydrolase
MAGVDHAVLLAVYTQLTSGYFTNKQLEEVLTDPRNVSADKTPGRTKWAWGLVSVNFDGYLAPGVAEARLKAVDSYLQQRPDLFIGIKLAHAHQGVAFDDARYWGIYDVAAKRGVPVLLHTGFSPFPNSKTEPKYYDPKYLETVATKYDGTHGEPRVTFILAHTGQGDARSVEHALALAESHDNVYLDLSALKRPLLLDEEGKEVKRTDFQYPHVIAEVKQRGLVSRVLWSTDGPQYSGMVRRYLHLLVDEMRSAGYTVEEISAVLSGNFYSLFFPDNKTSP